MSKMGAFVLEMQEFEAAVASTTARVEDVAEHFFNDDFERSYALSIFYSDQYQGIGLIDISENEDEL